MSMDQILTYRGVRYVIGTETSDVRNWTIFPETGPEEGAAAGVARASRTRGSFKEAVMRAREAIDAWLAEHAQSNISPS